VKLFYDAIFGSSKTNTHVGRQMQATIQSEMKLKLPNYGKFITTWPELEKYVSNVGKYKSYYVLVGRPCVQELRLSGYSEIIPDFQLREEIYALRKDSNAAYSRNVFTFFASSIGFPELVSYGVDLENLGSSEEPLVVSFFSHDELYDAIHSASSMGDVFIKRRPVQAEASFLIDETSRELLFELREFSKLREANKRNQYAHLLKE
jgi:hypothetical protein